jgi:predicted KAP-like P-loop ATPase
MEKKMFLPENPIDKYEDDSLGRKKFAEHLAKSVTEWKEKDSLVISLYGKWGIGKTSLLNMTIDYLKKQLKTGNEYNIVKFNPWAFSETDNLLEGFIDEIVSTIRKTKNVDKNLIKKLEYYSELLSLTPKKEEIKITFNAVFSILAICGITFSQLSDFISDVSKLINNLLFWGGLSFFSITIIYQILIKVLSFLKVRSSYNEKSINETKKDIIKILKEKSTKLLIVIDDIDRLSTQEIRQIFRIIRTNADFPNTIYLLAFDREVIEKNLEVQEGISGHDYLEKIVQVNFTLPCVSESKIHNYLFHELDQLLQVLPDSANKFFEKGTYWANIFHSGFKNYFKSIRDVKRFINGLEFNISQLIQEDIIEVNPIDFIAIELLRLFEPQYYDFLLKNKTVFTEVSSSYGGGNDEREKKKAIILESFDLVDEKRSNDLKSLVFELFPQVKGFSDGYGNMSYGHDSENMWTQELRICSSRMFDSYFNFIPGGDEKELSIYDLSKVSDASNNYSTFNELLDYYKSVDKFENLMVRIQDFTSKEEYFLKENFEIIIQALFDSFYNIPKSQPSFFGIGLDMQIVRVIFQLLRRNRNLDENFQILKNTTEKSKSLYGPLYYIGIEIQKDEKKSHIPDIIPPECIPEIKEICVKKILEFRDNLITDENFLYIMFRWREWSEDDEFENYIREITEDDISFLNFFDKFEYETRSQTSGDRGVQTHKRFHYNNLSEFCDLDEVKERIERIQSNESLYLQHRSAIDLFIKYFDKRNSDFFVDWDE